MEDSGWDLFRQAMRMVEVSTDLFGK